MFKEKYIVQSLHFLKQNGISVSREELDVLYEKRKNNKPVSLQSKGKLIGEKRTEEILDELDTDEVLMSGAGVVYLTDEEKNVGGHIDLKKLAVRNSYRKLEAKYLNTDPSLSKVYKSLQKAVKLSTNAGYGVSGEEGYILYDIDIAKSITYSGYQVTTTALTIMEATYNNIKLYNINELLRFLNNIMNDIDHYKSDVKRYITTDKTVNDVIIRLSKLASFDIGKHDKTIKNILSRYPDNINDFFYRSNIPAFFKDAKTSVVELFVSSPETLMDILKKNVWYEHGVIERSRASHDTRDNVTTVDTDSMFTYLETVLEIVEEKIGKYPDYKLEMTMVSIVNQFIKDFHKRYMINLQIPDIRHHALKMKSEFLITRLITTSSKKRYAYYAVAENGQIYDNPDTEVKGLDIKKTILSKNIRDTLMNILTEYILKPDNIDLRIVMDNVISVADIIIESIANSESTFALPSAIKPRDSYVDYKTNYVVKAVEFWNSIYVNNQIEDYTKPFRFKLRPNTTEEITEILKANNLYTPTYQALIDDWIGEGGFNYICLPRGESMDKWLQELVDIRSIVDSNISSFNPLLESLDAVIIPEQNTQRLTPFIDI